MELPQDPLVSIDEAVSDVAKSENSTTKHSSLQTPPSEMRTDLQSNKLETDIQSDAAFEQPAATSKSRIIYKTEYRNVHNDHIVFKADSDQKSNLRNKDGYAFEVVEVIFTLDVKGSGPGDADPAVEKLPSIFSVGNGHIVIYSEAIITALQTVVDYYPDLQLTSNPITIKAPYAVLVHYEDELSAYCAAFKAFGDSEAGENCRNTDTIQDIELLQAFVKEKVGQSVDIERKLHALETPVATFDMLWLLFRPGADVFVEVSNFDVYNAFVVKSVEFEMVNSSITFYRVIVWNMSADQNFIGPRTMTIPIESFVGEKDISSMAVFPCQYMRKERNKTTYEELKAVLIERGKMYLQLRRKKCMWFDGLTWLLPRRRYTGLVMVDPEEELFYESLDFWELQQGLDAVSNVTLTEVAETVSTGIPNCSCRRCTHLLGIKARRARFAGYSRINPKTVGSLTDHQYFLCNCAVMAFVFRIRRWQRLDVSGFSEPNFRPGILDSLVLREGRKNTIKNLVSMYIRHHTADESSPISVPLWYTDQIQGKGEALIFLLHGRPGVGKTYTAECIAEHTRRPLLTLTCADIGTNPSALDVKLQAWFKLAQNWDCILLIDEADVYMEYRETSDLERNNLVASFLRVLEYFKGILFLTTNRVGTFDEAFISRIQVKLHYGNFSNDERNKLWRNLFRSLEKERGDKMRIVQSAKDYVLEGREIRALEWNGREIKNAFQIAITLAESENSLDDKGRVIINEEHIHSTAIMAQDFKTYLDKLYHTDLSQRARIRMLRLDDFDEVDGYDKKSTGTRVRGTRAGLAEPPESRRYKAHGSDGLWPREPRQPESEEASPSKGASRRKKKARDGYEESEHKKGSGEQERRPGRGKGRDQASRHGGRKSVSKNSVSRSRSRIKRQNSLTSQQVFSSDGETP